MLTHHDSRAYAIVASDAAKHARSIMEKKIEEGRASTTRLFDHVMSQVPQDRIVRSGTLQFEDDPKLDELTIRVGGTNRPERDGFYTIHSHALGQMADKIGVPGAYLAKLVGGEEWQRELAADILNEHFHRGLPGGRFLARSTGGQVRGFLSDKFRRLDNRPLLEAFAGACQDVGAVPVEGVASETRIAMKAFLPMVFEPVPNEVMCLGVEWGNSDYGAARHSVRTMIWRLWCTNKATLEDALAQVHLGGRLPDDIELSQRTYELDTQASVSALRDVVRGLLGPAKVNALLEGIRQANEKNVEWKSLKTSLVKRLFKGELKAVEAAYESEDVINLPAGKSVWRMSNAISWIAGKAEDDKRRLELERIAGEVFNGKRDSEIEEAA
jgi:hypothetical protein